MKDYKDFSVDDLITDDRFIRWVRIPDAQLDKFWADFVGQHPDNLSKVQEAKQFLLALGSETISLPEDKLEMLHQHINDRLDTPVSASTVHRILTSRSKANRIYAYAAL